jgi:hypothetical protein
MVLARMLCKAKGQVICKLQTRSETALAGCKAVIFHEFPFIAKCEQASRSLSQNALSCLQAGVLFFHNHFKIKVGANDWRVARTQLVK